MFEDAMMESGGHLKTRSKYYTLIGALFNGTLLAAMILVPLLYPEALPKTAMSAMLVAPPPPPPPPPPAPLQQPHPVRMVPQLSEFSAPSRIPAKIHMGSDPSQPPSTDIGVQGMGGPANPAGDPMAGFANVAPASVQLATPKKISVSTGVMAGNILSKIDPAYPAIAKAARIQGTVILSATISKTGTIENLTVLSGPPMLAQSALDAVRNWRYKPYLLNGQPVEVQTTVNITFTLGS
jgi:protein TonB